VSFKKAALSELCDEIVVGHVGPSSGHRQRDGIPFLMGKNVGEGFLKLDDLERVTPEFHLSQKKSQLRPGDVVVVRIGKSGMAAKVPKRLGEANCAGLVVLKGPREVTADYLVCFLNSPMGRRESLRQTKGSTRQTLNTKSVAATIVPVPPLPEQKRIAGILDATDVLRAKRRESIAQLDALIQSTFLDMFGDPVTNPMGWEQQRIDRVFEVARGGSPRPIDAYLTDSSDGLNWIMIGDASEDSRYIASTKKRIKPEGLRKSRMVHDGDLLLTNSMSFGKPYILKTDGCIHDGWLVLSPKDKRMSADYFYSLLSTEALYREFQRGAAGAVVKNLNIKVVSQVSVAVPPFEIQHKFADIVESVEQQKARQRAHLAELDNLFASLQSRAFSGQL